MDDLLRNYCNSCKNDTKHHILHFKQRDTEVYSEKILVDKYYYMLECAGCECVSFLINHFIKSKDGDVENYGSYQYPERIWDLDDAMYLPYYEKDILPSNINSLYNEVEMSFKNESNVLAGIGLRVLVEATCLHQKINGDNLKLKIENLKKRGLISESEHPIIDKLREIGNASAHQIKSLPLDKLAYALQIVNHMLKSIYVLPKINKKLKI